MSPLEELLTIAIASCCVWPQSQLGFLVWCFGFMVVGGEWYSMWQSPMWNGQEAAFRFYMTILAVLIVVNQSDGDLAARARWSIADDSSEG